MGPRIFDLILREKRKSISDLDEEHDKASVQAHILAIHNLGDEMLLQGDYLEVLNHFRQASKTLLKLNLQNASELFSRRAMELYNLLKLRADFLSLLEREKQTRNVPKMKILYQEISELSKKLNDTFWTEEFQKEFEAFQEKLTHSQLKKLKKRGGSKTSELESKLHLLLESQAQLELPSITDETCNLSTNVQRFAIEELERKRKYFDEQGSFLEKKLLFKSAAQFYEKCERTTQHIIQLGKLGEQTKMDSYRNKRLECLNQNSKKTKLD